MRIEAEGGRRLDAFLADKIAGESRSSIARAISSGSVLVDGVARKASYKLSNGEVIHFEAAERQQNPDLAPIPIELSVPYEDEYLLVVDKPAGLSTHPAPSSSEATLVNALLARQTELSDEAGTYRPGIVHRLDKHTSGLLLVAKTNLVHRKLQAAIQRKEVERKYWAWVKGEPEQDAFTVRSFVGRHPKDRKRRAVVSESSPDARLAITHCRVLWRRAGITKLECRLETGRTHQIRVHLAAVGLPILGDSVYGVSTPGLQRQALHAVSLAFRHPVYECDVTVESPLPEDLALVD